MAAVGTEDAGVEAVGTPTAGAASPWMLSMDTEFVMEPMTVEASEGTIFLLRSDMVISS
jgi:hypothetical protein